MLRRNFLKAAISMLGTGLVAVLPKPPVPAKRVEGFYGWCEMGGAVVDGDPITRHLVGCDWIITEKKPLEVEPKTYQFSDPVFIGKSYYLGEEVIYIPRESHVIPADWIDLPGDTIAGPTGPIGPPGIPDVGVAVGPDEIITDHGRIQVENNSGKGWQPGDLVYLQALPVVDAPTPNRNGDVWLTGRGVGKSTSLVRAYGRAHGRA